MRATLWLLLFGLLGNSEAAFDIAIRIRYPESASSDCTTSDSNTYIDHVTDSVYNTDRRLNTNRNLKNSNKGLIRYCNARCNGFRRGTCYMVYPACKPGWDDRRNLRGGAADDATATILEEPLETTNVSPDQVQHRKLFMDFNGYDMTPQERNRLYQECVAVKTDMEATFRADLTQHAYMGSCEGQFENHPKVECMVVYIDD